MLFGRYFIIKMSSLSPARESKIKTGEHAKNFFKEVNWGVGVVSVTLNGKASYMLLVSFFI